jgi:hypothetical protein
MAERDNLARKHDLVKEELARAKAELGAIRRNKKPRSI